jgi:FtsH-binding integral membrane protein
MFTVCQGLGISSLITMFEYAAIFNAAAATGVMVSALSIYAYNNPSMDFLNMGNFLFLGLAGLLGLGIANMFYPSPILTSVYLFGGLMLFGGFVLYDT